MITFHDQTVKCIFGNGAEETVFADGTIQNVDTNGQRTISFPNGQREIHTQNFKVRSACPHFETSSKFMLIRCCHWHSGNPFYIYIYIYIYI